MHLHTVVISGYLLPCRSAYCVDASQTWRRVKVRSQQPSLYFCWSCWIGEGCATINKSTLSQLFTTSRLLLIMIFQPCQHNTFVVRVVTVAKNVHIGLNVNCIETATMKLDIFNCCVCLDFLVLLVTLYKFNNRILCILHIRIWPNRMCSCIPHERCLNSTGINWETPPKLCSESKWNVLRIVKSSP